MENFVPVKLLVFFNNKGGVGKTTLACNVVSFMNMHRNKRVLLIDADPQCNATQGVLSDELLDEIYADPHSERKTLYSYLKPLEQGDASINSVLVPIPSTENGFGTDLIPGHPNMSLVEDRLSQAWSDLQGADPIRGYRISNWLAQLLKHVDQYDLVIFDVGPSLGALNRDACSRY
jgi:cellulose biosynthesis protein BcsQ